MTRAMRSCFTCFTCTKALNIGGSTIHRFLQLNEQEYIKANKLKKIKEDYDYITVDEVSMVSKDLWRHSCLLKQEDLI
jgi:hypothetical protein